MSKPSSGWLSRKRRHEAAYRLGYEDGKRAATSVTTSYVGCGNATNDVLAERKRQVDVEGWTSNHDDAHGRGELLLAAKAYFAHATGRALSLADGERAGIPFGWPWDKKWWKPKTPRQDLVRAGALALAEIERIKRLYHVRAEHRYMDAEAYYRLIIAELERLDGSAQGQGTAAIAQMNAVVDAWEALAGGRQVLNSDIEKWLADDMAPAINSIRAFLRRPRPDGVIPAAPEKQEGGDDGR